MRIDGQQCGPFKKHELLENGLERNTLVWSRKLTNWTPAYKVKELESILEQLPPEDEQEEIIVASQTASQVATDLETQQEQTAIAETPPEHVESPTTTPSIKYYLHIDDKDVGPFSITDLEAIGITRGTYVWHKGMEKWAKAENVEALAHLVVDDEPQLDTYDYDDADIPPPFDPNLLITKQHPQVAQSVPPIQSAPVAPRRPAATSAETAPPRRDSLGQAITTLVCCNPVTFAFLTMLAPSSKKTESIISLSFIIILILSIIAVSKAGLSRVAYVKGDYEASNSLGLSARIFCSIVYWLYFITFILIVVR